MKFIWHIIKKDIRRERCALLVWALLFVGQMGIGWVMLHREGFDLTNMTHVQFAAGVLVFLQVVMGYILVTRLVHADAVVGTNMFWCTRPVLAARLLVAKALGALLIFGLLPVFLLLPWWMYCDFGWREILWTALETLGWQLLMIVPAFLVASLTDDLGRVLLWSLLLVVALFSWIALLQSSQTALLGKDIPLGGPGRIYTKLWLAALTFLVGGAAISAYQYLTRRFVRSVIMAAAGLGLVALIGQLCPWNWAPEIARLNRPTMSWLPSDFGTDIEFEVLPSQDMTRPSARGKRGLTELDTSLNLRMRVQGLPDDLQLGVHQVEQTWIWPDGVRITRGGNYSLSHELGDATLRRRFSMPSPAPDPETVEWEKTRRANWEAGRKARGSDLPLRRRWTALDTEGRVLQGYTTLPNSFAEKMRKQPPAYEARFQGVLYRQDVVAELPLKIGANTSFASQTFRIRQLQADKPLVLTTTPAVMTQGLWLSGAIGGEQIKWRKYGQALALNRVTGHISGVGDNQAGSRSFIVAGVDLHLNIFYIGGQQVIRNGQNAGISALDPQWMDHTTVVFFSPAPVGRFSREIKTGKFTLVEDYWEEDGSAARADGKP